MTCHSFPFLVRSRTLQHYVNFPPGTTGIWLKMSAAPYALSTKTGRVVFKFVAVFSSSLWKFSKNGFAFLFCHHSKPPPCFNYPLAHIQYNCISLKITEVWSLDHPGCLTFLIFLDDTWNFFRFCTLYLPTTPLHQVLLVMPDPFHTWLLLAVTAVDTVSFNPFFTILHLVSLS